jgi:murein DD-endopeptidase MepM/ murein hydrolase activator NlpD
MVAAPLGAETVPVDIEVTFLDGTRLSQILTLLVMATDFPATRLRVASRYTSPDSATQERAAYERAAVQPFELPLSGITTSPFGQRRLFNNELRSRHTGLDIDGDTGDPVYAANSGRVAMSADLFYNGGAVFIDHGLGLYTGYFHLSKREVDLGQHVKKGQIIGRVGATGRVTGPHLHWHMYLQGFSLDPRSLLDPDFAQIVRALSRTALDAPEP